MRVIVLASGFVFLTASCAWAQNYAPWPGAYYESRASTPAESAARGMADVTRAAGERNLMNSQAAINATEAQRNDIQNRQLWTNTYFQMRETNRAYREAERRPRPTMEDAVRYAQAGKPKPLSTSQVDHVSGKISWPGPLAMSSFDATRAELDKLYAKRSQQGGLSYEDQREVRELTDAMLADLKKQIKDIPPMDYSASKNFLQSLRFEARKPVG